MYKALFFDFFGVVRGAAYEAWLDRRGLKREGVLREASRAMDAGFISLSEFLQAISDEVGEEPEDILTEINGGAVINSEVVTLIGQLKSKYKIGLLSNSSTAMIKPLLDDHGLSSLFDTVIVSSEVGHIKPSPEIFQAALERFDITASEAIFIDDNQANVDGATAIGITGLLFSGAVKLREDLERLGVI